MEIKKIKQLIILLSCCALMTLAGCVVQKEVVVVVTATPEPGSNTVEVPTATLTPLPPPTVTPAPTKPEYTPLPPAFPTPIEAQIYVAEQVFEHGRMFWIEPLLEIWVIVEGGEWLIYEDTFVKGDPEDDPSLTPPPDLRQPIRGFGKVWREHPELQESLGWAVDTEYGYTTAYRFDHGGHVDEDGVYVKAPGVFTIVTLGNETLHFYEHDSSWAFE